MWYEVGWFLKQTTQFHTFGDALAFLAAEESESLRDSFSQVQYSGRQPCRWEAVLLKQGPISPTPCPRIVASAYVSLDSKKSPSGIRAVTRAPSGLVRSRRSYPESTHFDFFGV